MPSNGAGSAIAIHCAGWRSEAPHPLGTGTGRPCDTCSHELGIRREAGDPGCRPAVVGPHPPRNQRAYGTSSTLFDLAAGYGVAIVKNHPCVDGNKRVDLTVMYVFLDINGYQLDAPEVEAVDVMLRLAAEELVEKGLSQWLKANSNSYRGQR